MYFNQENDDDAADDAHDANDQPPGGKHLQPAPPSRLGKVRLAPDSCHFENPWVNLISKKQ